MLKNEISTCRKKNWSAVFFIHSFPRMRHKHTQIHKQKGERERGKEPKRGLPGLAGMSQVLPTAISFFLYLKESHCIQVSNDVGAV